LFSVNDFLSLGPIKLDVGSLHATMAFEPKLVDGQSSFPMKIVKSDFSTLNCINKASLSGLDLTFPQPHPALRYKTL
jgi:hypothetical protein